MPFSGGRYLKKIIILFNHFQIQDGVAKTAICLANELIRQDNIEVTLCPLFKYDKELLSHLEPGVKITPFLKFYFRGLAKIVDIIPDSVLYRLIVREKYDIEIGYCMKLPIKIIAAGNSDCIRYAWMHGYDEGLTLKSCYKKMDKVICVSKANAERFERETEGLIPSTYCYNLIDERKVKEMAKMPIEIPKTNEIIFIAVGRLEANKGILRLIEVAGKLKQNGYRFRIWLVGDGEQKEILKKRTAELHLEEIVSFLGAQANPHAYTARADVLVCASYSEGYSTSCAEAVVLGVPVLTTNVSGGKEIIEESKAGMLVGMEDKDIYNGMRQILEHPELIQQWKKTLVSTSNCFSYQNRAKQLKKTLCI